MVRPLTSTTFGSPLRLYWRPCQKIPRKSQGTYVSEKAAQPSPPKCSRGQKETNLEFRDQCRDRVGFRSNSLTLSFVLLRSVASDAEWQVQREGPSAIEARQPDGFFNGGQKHRLTSTSDDSPITGTVAVQECPQTSTDPVNLL